MGMAKEQRTGMALQHAILCYNPGHKAELARRYNIKAALPRKPFVSLNRKQVLGI